MAAASRPERADVRTELLVEARSGALLLRKPRESDAPRALELARDPEVAWWNPTRVMQTVADALDWCRDGADWSDGTHATWHAEDETTGLLVANVSLFAFDHDDLTCKIGYRVHPDARGRGVGRAAVTAVAEWALADRGLARVQLEHSLANVASCRVADAAGFALEGTLRSAHRLPDGSRCDAHVHGRVAGEA